MVAFFTPPPMMKAKVPFNASYLGVTGALSASAVVTQSATVDIGAPDPTRLVVVVIHHQRSGATTVSSVTIGGIAATVVGNTAGSNVGVAIAYAKVPTGTTATVSVTFAAAPSANGVRMGVYRIVGQNNDAPGDSQISNGAGDAARTINAAGIKGGCIISGHEGTSTAGITGGGMVTNYAYTGSNTDVGKAGLIDNVSATGAISLSTTSRCGMSASWS